MCQHILSLYLLAFILLSRSKLYGNTSKAYYKNDEDADSLTMYFRWLAEEGRSIRTLANDIASWILRRVGYPFNEV